MAEIRSVRRYYLGKRRQAFERDRDITTQWHAKQNAEPGTDLPSGFPFLVPLAAGFYTTIEDLDGADNEEIVQFTDLNDREATAVFAALAPLL